MTESTAEKKQPYNAETNMEKTLVGNLCYADLRKRFSSHEFYFLISQLGLVQ